MTTTPALNDDLVRELRDVANQLTPGAIERADLDGMAISVGKSATALETLAAENAALRSANAALQEYAHEATKAITGLVGGGSECFAGKIGDQYKADLKFCVERLRDREARSHERLLAENRKRRDAEAARTTLTGAR